MKSELVLKFRRKLFSSGNMLNNSLLTVLGFVISNAIRFGGNLVLSRIFAPDVFGLMAIITAIMIGLELLSDIGIRTSVVQNEHGEAPSFLKTAWTMQVIRGLLLWLILCVVAFPLAGLYNEPLLVYILPVLGLTMVIKGFTSTSEFLYQRKLIIKEPLYLEIFSQFIGLVTTLCFAIYFQNIWAFVFGWIVSIFVKTLGSHLYLRDGIVGFELNRHYFSQIIKFGKWIFLATVLTYISGQGDRLLLGVLLTKTELGLYNLASMFAQLIATLFVTLSSKIILPALCKANNDSQSELTQALIKVRRYILTGFVPVILILATFGHMLIELLYTEPYHNAGSILQLLTIAIFLQLLSSSKVVVLLAVGDSFRHMVAMGIWAFGFLIGLVAGFAINELSGMIIGICVASLCWYPVASALVSNYVKNDYMYDVLILSFVLIVTYFIWHISGFHF